MNNKDYITKELLNTIKNIEEDMGYEIWELEIYFENIIKEINKNF